MPLPSTELELIEAQRLARLGSWRLDFETGTVRWSEVLYEIFGFHPSDPVPNYDGHAAIFTAESFARLDAAVQHAIATGAPYTLDLEIRLPSGEPRWITARGEAIRDHESRIVALRGTVSDITERQQLLTTLAERERALAHSDQSFRASFNSMFQFMAILAPDGTLLEVNEAALAFTTGPASEQQGKRFWDTDWWRVSEAVRDGVRQAVARAASGEFVRYDVELVLAGNRRITVDFSIKPVYDDDGRVVLLIPEGRDVTEERSTSAALHKTKERLQAIFNSTFQFIGLLTPDGTLIEVNGTASQFTGLPPDQLIGRRFWDCHWWTHDATVQSQLRAAIERAAQGEFMRYDTRVQGANGSLMTIDFSLKPVRNDDGEITLLILEGRDVTEERRTRAALAESEDRFRLSMKNAPIGQALVSVDGRWLSVNESLCTMLGYSESELLTRAFQDVTHPDDLDEDFRCREALIAGTCDRFQLARRYVRRDGNIVSVQLDTSLLRNAAGEPLHFITQIQDVTARRELEARQEALMQRLTLALRASGIGVWEWDLKTDLLTWDTALRRIYGVGHDEPIDYQRWRSAVVADDLMRAEVTLQDALREKRRGATEFRIVHPKLGIRFIESLFVLALDERGTPQRMIGVNLDVTDRWLAEQRLSDSNRQLERRVAEVSALQEQLRDQAIRDGLTGLYNRRHLDEWLGSELAQAASECRGISLLMADLDCFKSINDRFGHQGGDALLLAWSDLLRRNLRASDLSCRYGGEEFVIVLPGSSLADAASRAEQLRSLFEALSLPTATGSDGLRTTVSIGVEHAAAGRRSAEQLIRAADAALYRAKAEGRNRVVCERTPDPGELRALAVQAG